MTDNSHLAVLLNRNDRTHEVEENGDIISLSPLRDAPEKDAMAIFQEFADYVLKWDGYDYRIINSHISSDHGEHDYDLIVVERLDRPKTAA